MATQTKQAPTASGSILDVVRHEPGITVAELVVQVRRLNIAREVLEVVRDAMTTVITTPPQHGDDLEEEWGEAPTATQLAVARERGERARSAALADVLVGALTRERAASRLGVTAQAVSERRKVGKLTAVRRGREWRFPAWQFSAEDTVAGLPELIAAWPGTAMALSTWATTPTPDLGDRTPAETLTRRDGSKHVLDLVEAISAAAW